MRLKVRLTRVVIGGVVVGLIAVLALPAIGLATVVFQAQDEPPRQLNSNDLARVQAGGGPRASASVAAFNAYRAPGVLISRGTNAQPTGASGLVTYVLEEVAIPAGVQIRALGGQAIGPTVARLTVLGGPFTVGAISPVIWLDDRPLQPVRYGADLQSLSVLVPDRSVLRSGAAISVSYGPSPEMRERLPETLTLGTGAP
jgi:hypothetical protein